MDVSAREVPKSNRFLRCFWLDSFSKSDDGKVIRDLGGENEVCVGALRYICDRVINESGRMVGATGRPSDSLEKAGCK